MWLHANFIYNEKKHNFLANSKSAMTNCDQDVRPLRNLKSRTDVK